MIFFGTVHVSLSCRVAFLFSTTMPCTCTLQICPHLPSLFSSLEVYGTLEKCAL
ncbi:hypothetical protein WG66_003159 [Moniliophthora roreri]|nr:hypothetical protein WG66_003159 [Moniliophthora roreri]